MCSRHIIPIHALTLGVAVWVTTVAPAKTIYVDADAPGGNSGSSWINAFNYLQDALTAAESAAKPVEICVAQGTYRPDQGGGGIRGDREAAFLLINGVTIKGGYAGYGEADANEQNFETHETILSGDLSSNDAEVSDPVKLLDDPTRAENSCHVVTANGTDNSAVLVGFTISSGNGNGRWVAVGTLNDPRCGAGIYAYEGSPTIRSCRFVANAADRDAGGIYARHSTMILDGCSFIGNWSGTDGGAIDCRYSDLSLAQCEFQGNVSDHFGGALFSIESDTSLSACAFSHNRAAGMGGAIMDFIDCNSMLVDCTFSGNQADGGDGGAIQNYNCNTIELDRCTFTANTCLVGSGGAVNAFSSNRLVAAHCSFTANSSREHGGGMSIEHAGPATLSHCSFTGNTSTWWSGGALNSDHVSLDIHNSHFGGNQASSGGCAYSWDSDIAWSNCTFTENVAQAGSGSVFFAYDSSYLLRDCQMAGGGNRAVHVRHGEVNIEGNVKLNSVDWYSEDVLLGGTGTLQVDENTRFNLEACTIHCGMSGPGRIEIPRAEKVILESDAIIDLSGGATQQGKIECDGLLWMRQNAKIVNAQLNITRANVAGNAIIANCVISAEAGGPFGQFFVEDDVIVELERIEADGDRYLDYDPTRFDSSRVDIGVIDILITEGRGGQQGGLFELRGQPLNLPPCDPDAFFCKLNSIPGRRPETWTIDRMELLPHAKLNLTNRFDFQYPYDADGADEVLYVKELILGSGSVLNTAFNRIYYEQLIDRGGSVVNIPLLGFSLNNITLDDETEFLNRVTHNSFEHPDISGYDRIHVGRIAYLEPDPKGMMRMCNLVDRVPDSTQYGEVVNARAKGLFAKASEDQILIFFEYLFETSDPGTELVVYLSDTPGLLEHSDARRAEHYMEVARLVPPPAGRPGAPGSGRFGVFQESVSAGHLNFVRGTRIEFELLGPEGTCILINDWDPQVQCYAICKDVTWDNFVDTQDFMTVIREYGLSAGLTADGNGRACLEGAFSQDGYVDYHDISGWDWILNLDSRLNFCNAVPLTGENAAMNAVSVQGPGGPVPVQNLPSALTGVLVMGKGGAKNADKKLEDQLCILDYQGQHSEDFGLPISRGNTKLLVDSAGAVYQLSAEGGLFGLPDGKSILPPGGLSIPSDPRYAVSATVCVGLQAGGVNAWGRPISDAAFDAQGYLYVVPVVVHPVGQNPYLSAAKLELKNGQTPPYDLIRLYDDPPPPDDNQQRNALREIEVDNDGRVYVTNAHQLNESDILWVFDANGGVDRIGLVAQDAGFIIPAPVALCAARYDSTLYLASGQNAPDAVTSVVYGLSTNTLEIARSITLHGMGHITGITEDSVTGTLWVAGFTMTNIPDYPNPSDVTFYRGYLAEIPYGSDKPVDARLVSSESDLALPMSILWVSE